MSSAPSNIQDPSSPSPSTLNPHHANQIPCSSSSRPSSLLDEPLTINHQPSTVPSTPSDEETLPLYKGETENAYSAFCTFLALGPDRDHQKTADATGTSIHTIRFWSAKFRWKERIQLLNTQKL